jgi:ABC-type Na+ efflux pump permease subunit
MELNESTSEKVHSSPRRPLGRETVLQYRRNVREGNMRKLRIWATVSLTLGILGLAALFLSFAALTDIFHGEENVSLEWGILRLAFFVIFFLIVATFICTGLVLKYFRDKDEEREAKTPD